MLYSCSFTFPFLPYWVWLTDRCNRRLRPISWMWRNFRHGPSPFDASQSKHRQTRRCRHHPIVIHRSLDRITFLTVEPSTIFCDFDKLLSKFQMDKNFGIHRTSLIYPPEGTGRPCPSYPDRGPRKWTPAFLRWFLRWRNHLEDWGGVERINLQGWSPSKPARHEKYEKICHCFVCVFDKWPQTKCKVTFDSPLSGPAFLGSFTW